MSAAAPRYGHSWPLCLLPPLPQFLTPTCLPPVAALVPIDTGCGSLALIKRTSKFGGQLKHAWGGLEQAGINLGSRSIMVYQFLVRMTGMAGNLWTYICGDVAGGPDGRTKLLRP